MLLLFLINHFIHNCTYDENMASLPIYYSEVYHKRTLREESWENIRIHFDYRYMDGTINNGKTCYQNGASVTYNGVTYTCTQDDVLTTQKAQAAKQTMENVRIYLQKLLKVIPLTKSITVRDYFSYTKYNLPYSVSNADLYMGILVRPYGNINPLATAGSNTQEPTYYRPIVGAVFLNGRSLPTAPQNENSTNCQFFYVCVHEIFHALGISNANFNYYHPYGTNKPHEQITCSFTKSGKRFTFLVTPYAHIFAKKQFGVETFYGDDGNCPSGIEIEDGGGKGTRRSHVEGRTYMTDLMTGVTIQTTAGPFNRLTDATLAILQDTGNYKVNWRMGQPLVWGHPESINDQYIKDFATGPPQNVFPAYYNYDASNNYPIGYTGFNFKYYGPTNAYNAPSCPNSNSDLQKYCNAKSFYNPKSYSKTGQDAVYDFMPLIYPNSVCPKGQATLLTSLQGSKQCGTYKCNGYESFTIEVPIDTFGGKKTVTCTKSNVGKVTSDPLYISSDHQWSMQRMYWCPDPERFCRSVKLSEMYFRNDPFLNYTKQLVDVPDPNPPTPTPKTPTPTPKTPTPTPKTPTPDPKTPTPDPKNPTPDPKPQNPTPESQSQTAESEKPTQIISNSESSSTSNGNNSQDDNSNDKSNKEGLLSGKMKWVIIGSIIGAVVVVAIIVVVVVVVRKHKSANEDSDDRNFLV